MIARVLDGIDFLGEKVAPELFKLVAWAAAAAAVLVLADRIGSTALQITGYTLLFLAWCRVYAILPLGQWEDQSDGSRKWKRFRSAVAFPLIAASAFLAGGVIHLANSIAAADLLLSSGEVASDCGPESIYPEQSVPEDDPAPPAGEALPIDAGDAV